MPTTQKRCPRCKGRDMEQSCSTCKDERYVSDEEPHTQAEDARANLEMVHQLKVDELETYVECPEDTVFTKKDMDTAIALAFEVSQLSHDIGSFKKEVSV